MGDKYKILIVDDEEEVREVLSILIETFGYDFETAVNGREGLEKLKTDHFDIVISDFSMPELTGMQLLKKIREAGLDIPFLFLSAYSNKEITLEALKHGAFDFIEKPFESSDLRIIIKEALKVSKDRQNITKKKNILVENNENNITLLDESEAAAREIEKLTALPSIADSSTSSTKEEKIKNQFLAEARNQLKQADKALRNIQLDENFNWELGFLFRTMRGISSTANALREKDIERFTSSLEKVYSFFRVRNRQLNAEKLELIRNTHKVLSMMLEQDSKNNSDIEPVKKESLRNLDACTIEDAS